MTDQRKDGGGQAFPSESDYEYHRGMCLRDWFAGQAIVGLHANESLTDGASIAAARSGIKGGSCALMAKAAYELADAMLEARKQ